MNINLNEQIPLLNYMGYLDKLSDALKYSDINTVIPYRKKTKTNKQSEGRKKTKQQRKSRKINRKNQSK